MRRHSYRGHLRAAVAASAAPYGYTLTIWTSGAVATHANGIPTAGEALLFLLGAVAGFGVTAAAAHGSPTGTLVHEETAAVRLWGAFHLASAGLAIAAAALVTAVLDAPIAWLAVGFAATVTYLVVIAAQFTAAESRGG